MFPIPWNFPFRKKDGTVGKIEDLGGSYELPVASSETLGGVKIGSGITIDENGAISASGGAEIHYLVKDVEISSGMSNPPNSYTMIYYDELPYNAIILSCQYTSHDTQASLRSAIIAYLGRGTETGVEARWLLMIDTTTGSKIISRGDVVIAYIVPES